VGWGRDKWLWTRSGKSFGGGEDVRSRVSVLAYLQRPPERRGLCTFAWSFYIVPWKSKDLNPKRRRAAVA
jgi:hypothetical protein